MEEFLLSGYCFQADQARIVEAEFDGHQLLAVDCLYENCMHHKKCEIGRRIAEREGKSD